MTRKKRSAMEPKPKRARPSQSAAGAPSPENTPSVCDEFAPALTAYVDDLVHGEPIERQYSRLLTHLRGCAHCRQTLDDLRAALTASPLDASFAAQLAGAPWQTTPDWTERSWAITPLSQLRRPRRGLAIQLSPQLFGVQPMLAVRGDSTDGRATLMAAELSLDTQLCNVELYTERQPDGMQLLLCAQFIIDESVPLRVTLRWDGESFVAETDLEGQVCFTDLHLTRESPPPAAVTVEVEMLL